jgi:error-prone DNA polymerase
VRCLVQEFAEGLTCLTGDGDGPLAVAIRKNEGRQRLERLQSIFGRGNLYAEIQRHRDRDEDARTQAVIALARNMQIPLVATNGAVTSTKPRAKSLMSSPACTIR